MTLRRPDLSGIGVGRSGRTGRAGTGRPGRAGGLAAALLVAGIIALAFNLRAAITSVPPLFPEISARLQLSPGKLAVLAAVPVVCFGLFSAVAAPLSRRFGEERVLGSALLLLAAGLVLRGVAPRTLLFPGTAAAAVVAVPVFAASGGNNWAVRLSLGLWALPALVAAVAWLPQLRFRTLPGSATVPGTAGHHGVLAMGRFALAWQVMAFMGLQSLLYYAALSWFPTMFRDRGASAVHAGDLLALMNFGNAVTAMLLPVLAHRARDQRVLVAVSTVAMSAGMAGSAFAPLGSAAGWMLLLGLGQGATLGLGIFLTMARAPNPATAASLSGFAQGAGYLLASAGPLFVGLLHSVTGGWAIPVGALLGVAGVEAIAGWLAGRALTLPLPRS